MYSPSMMNPLSLAIPGWKLSSEILGGREDGFHFPLKSSYKGYQCYDDLSRKYYGTIEDKERGADRVFSETSNLGLLQNCDLPPPLKIFSGANRHVHNAPTSSIQSRRKRDEDVNEKYGMITDDKLEVLKALQLSQTRAREAEKKVALMTQEKDQLSVAFLNDSMQLLAHRQWVKLLELEILQLRLQEKQQHKESSSSKKSHNSEDAGNIAWSMVLALWVGIAGIGFAYGYMLQQSFSISCRE